MFTHVQSSSSVWKRISLPCQITSVHVLLCLLMTENWAVGSIACWTLSRDFIPGHITTTVSLHCQNKSCDDKWLLVVVVCASHEFTFHLIHRANICFSRNKCLVIFGWNFKFLRYSLIHLDNSCVPTQINCALRLHPSEVCFFSHIMLVFDILPMETKGGKKRCCGRKLEL